MDSIIAGLHCLHWHKILPLQWVVNCCDWITETVSGTWDQISPIHAGLMHLFSGFTEKKKSKELKRTICSRNRYHCFSHECIEESYVKIFSELWLRYVSMCLFITKTVIQLQKTWNIVHESYGLLLWCFCSFCAPFLICVSWKKKKKHLWTTRGRLNYNRI